MQIIAGMSAEPIRLIECFPRKNLILFTHNKYWLRVHNAVVIAEGSKIHLKLNVISFMNRIISIFVTILDEGGSSHELHKSTSFESQKTLKRRRTFERGYGSCTCKVTLADHEDNRKN
ncbi:hypothetical protein GQX74_010938 [Glossina fuscipes]|nr:hypothetical protein GQX74_010938 [Glossina fuscipes]